MPNIYQFEIEFDDILLSNDDIELIYSEIDNIIDHNFETNIYTEEIPNLKPTLLQSPIKLDEKKIRILLKKMNITKNISYETIEYISTLIYTKLYHIIQDLSIQSKYSKINISQLLDTIQSMENTKIIL